MITGNYGGQPAAHVYVGLPAIWDWGQTAFSPPSSALGIFCWEESDAFAPGMVAAASFCPGLTESQEFVPGLVAGQGEC
jgi:hypothetical protein